MRINYMKCITNSGRHKWSSDNNVTSSGGGIKYIDQCKECGCIRKTNTWDNHPETGYQPTTVIRYSEPD